MEQIELILLTVDFDDYKTLLTDVFPCSHY